MNDAGTWREFFSRLFLSVQFVYIKSNVINKLHYIGYTMIVMLLYHRMKLKVIGMERNTKLSVLIHYLWNH